MSDPHFNSCKSPAEPGAATSTVVREELIASEETPNSIQAALLDELGIIVPTVSAEPLVRQRLARIGRLLTVNQVNLSRGAIEIGLEENFTVSIEASKKRDIGMSLRTNNESTQSEDLVIDIGSRCKDMHQAQTDMNAFFWLGALTAAQLRSEVKPETWSAEQKKKDLAILAAGTANLVVAKTVPESIIGSTIPTVIGGVAFFWGTVKAMEYAFPRSYENDVMDLNQGQSVELAKKFPVFSIGEGGKALDAYNNS